MQSSEPNVQAFLSCLQPDALSQGMFGALEFVEDPFQEVPFASAKHPELPSSRSSTASDSGSGSDTGGATASRSSNDSTFSNSSGGLINQALADNLRMVQQMRYQRTDNRKRGRHELESKSEAPPLEELLEEADLKRKRLARKAELARLSRKRKKTRVVELESEVANLKEELERERAKVAELEEERLKQMVSVDAGNPNSVDLDERLKFKFAEICRIPLKTEDKSGASAGPIKNAVQDYFDAHKNKAAYNDLQMANLEASMSSCVATSFVRWVLNQGDRFYDGDNPGGLWTSLFKNDLGCSADQLQSMQDLRCKMKCKLQEWNEVETAFRRLSPLLRSYFSDSSAILKNFVSLLTPAQTTQFLQWVEKFGEVCVKITV
mmetsp:Transcript_16557/g.23244  ORF Transcript_16557/g.23244 Transcript_16557/m.23244 type:complete len:378 (+) Transcript_16557:467-1600(+)